MQEISFKYKVRQWNQSQTQKKLDRMVDCSVVLPTDCPIRSDPITYVFLCAILGRITNTAYQVVVLTAFVDLQGLIVSTAVVAVVVVVVVGSITTIVPLSASSSPSTPSSVTGPLGIIVVVVVPGARLRLGFKSLHSTL